jgi:hypothetical protein
MVIPVIVTLIVAAFIFYQLGYFDKYKASSTDVSEVKEILKKEQEQTVAFPEKEKLLFKILDSIDYLTNAEGEYVVFDKEMNETTNYKYAFDVEKKKSLITIITNNTPERTTIDSVDDRIRLGFDEINKTYQEFELVISTPNEEYKELSATERILRNDRTDNNWILGQIVSTEYLSHLSVYENWEFEEVTFLGLPSYKITGIIDSQLSEDLSGNFEMVFDKNTGLLLDFRSFNENNEVKFSLSTESIKINEGLNENTFEKDLSAYEKIEVDRSGKK